MLKALFGLLSFENIRKNLQFFINRLIIGSLTTIFLLLNDVNIDYNPAKLINKNILLILTVFVIIITMYILFRLIPKKPKFIPLQKKLKSFENDFISVIISGYILFIPSLLYEIIFGNIDISSDENIFALSINGILILMMIDRLLFVQSNLDSFLPSSWGISFQKNKEISILIKYLTSRK